MDGQLREKRSKSGQRNGISLCSASPVHPVHPCCLHSACKLHDSFHGYLVHCSGVPSHPDFTEQRPQCARKLCLRLDEGKSCDVLPLSEEGRFIIFVEKDMYYVCTCIIFTPLQQNTQQMQGGRKDGSVHSFQGLCSQEVSRHPPRSFGPYKTRIPLQSVDIMSPVTCGLTFSLSASHCNLLTNSETFLCD